MVIDIHTLCNRVPFHTFKVDNYQLRNPCDMRGAWGKGKGACVTPIRQTVKLREILFEKINKGKVIQGNQLLITCL